MKRKNEFIILFVIIAVLISYLLLHKKDRTHYRLPAIAEIAKDRISQIEIDIPNHTVVLNKKDNTWYIGPQAYPAAPEKIDAMLNVIEGLTITALVSESKNYIRYDLSEDKKITVKVLEGNTLSRQFDIGKTATTYRHTFVKLDQDPHVYHARGDFRHKFDVTLDKLRDKTVLSFEAEHIKMVHISKEKETYTIKRNEQPEAGTTDNDSKPSTTQEPKITWVTDDGRRIDESALKRLLSSLSSLDCESYINDSKKEDFADPDFVVELTGKTKTYSLTVFPKPDKKSPAYPAISTENQYPFLLSNSQVDNIKKMIEENLKKEEKKTPAS